MFGVQDHEDIQELGDEAVWFLPVEHVDEVLHWGHARGWVNKAVPFSPSEHHRIIVMCDNCRKFSDKIQALFNLMRHLIRVRVFINEAHGRNSPMQGVHLIWIFCIVCDEAGHAHWDISAANQIITEFPQQ